MAGTTKQVRSRGNPESALYVLTQEYNKALADLETLRTTVNTANGGTTGLPLAAASLTAASIAYVVG